MSSVSVVMVTYYTGTPLWLAVDSVLMQPECSELIIVNNGNPAGVEQLLAERARATKRITLISGQGNVGFAKACNLGADAATGDYILLLNPDSMLAEGALAKVVEAMSHYPEKTLAGCFLANPSGSEQRGGRRALLTPFNALAESLGVGFVLPPKERLNQNSTPMPENAHEVPAISGSFMLLPRSFYTSLKGMDEGYFLHMEDMDFCYRVHKAGGKVVCLPQVKVIHFRSTSEVPSAIVEKHKTKGFIRYLATHFSDYGPALLLVNIGLYVRYYLKRVINTVNRWFEPPLQAREQVARLVLLHRQNLLPKNSTLAGKTVLLTGASGQLGLCLIGPLLAAGAQVIAVKYRTRIDFEHDNLSWADRDLDGDANALQGAEVDVVIHAADLTYLPPYLPALIEGGAKRVVVVGCISALEKLRSSVKGERKVASQYEAHINKLLETGKEKGSAVTVMLASDMYGVALDRGISKQADIIRRFGKFPLNVFAEGRRTPVHTQDVAAAVMAVLGNEATHGQRYALGGATMLTYREMMTRLFAYMGKTPRFFYIPYLANLLTGLGFVYGLKGVSGDIIMQMNRDVCSDNAAAYADFGYAPRAFLEGETGL